MATADRWRTASPSTRLRRQPPGYATRRFQSHHPDTVAAWMAEVNAKRAAALAQREQIASHTPASRRLSEVA